MPRSHAARPVGGPSGRRARRARAGRAALGAVLALAVAGGPVALTPRAAAAQPTSQNSSNPTGTVTTEVTNFLTHATQSLQDNEVVHTMCRAQSTIAQFASLYNQVGQVLSTYQNIASSFGNWGLPVADLGASIAGNTYAKASDLSSRAESFASSFGMGALCNTSETRRLVQSQFQFLHSVVNNGIEQALPGIRSAIHAAFAGSTPVADNIRRARYDRLMFHGGSTADAVRTAAGGGEVAEDSAAMAAYNAATKAEQAASVAGQKLAALAAELDGAPPVADSTGHLVCTKVDDNGDVTHPTPYPRTPPDTGLTCGPISPGRADQTAAAAALAGGSQLVLLTQMANRRADLEAMRARTELRRQYLQDFFARQRGIR